MDEYKLYECLDGLEKTLTELKSDIANSKSKGDKLRTLVLENQFYDTLEMKEVMLALYRKLKGGKNEIVYPTA
ncbi:MAG: hypothetical protein QXR60_04750 [Candidatus Nanoarchaeia archaeon]